MIIFQELKKLPAIHKLLEQKMKLSHKHKLRRQEKVGKDQLISKRPFGVFKSPKKPMKNFPGKKFVGFLGALKTPKGHFKIT